METGFPSRRAFMKVATSFGAGFTGIPVASTVQCGVRGSSASRMLDICEFGARGDGRTVDSSAINKAIEAASSMKGGIIYFPAGLYLCYSIRLKSNVQLLFGNGATIIAAETKDGSTQGYDLAEANPWDHYQDFGHSHWHNSLIWGEDLDNVSIVGPGMIWGKGLSRGEEEGPVAERPGVGNKAISLKHSRNVLLRDFSIRHGGHFGVLATGVDNLTIDNLTIDTNRDGIDVDCCRAVHISNCSVNSPRDDGICLKSSFALGYPRATEMVTITNCMLSGSFIEGTLLDGTFQRYPGDAKVGRNGRIKFGTESNGGYKNIAISNCVFDGCLGLAIESVDGAIIEDVSIVNVTMRDLIDSPIFIRLGSRMRGPSALPVGTIRRVNIAGLVCSGNSSKICSMIAGIPNHNIEDIKIHNVLISLPGGGTEGDAALQLAEREDAYPEPNMFGTTPAYGFVVRHAQGIEISDVTFALQGEDMRPCFLVDDVDEIDFFNIKPDTARGNPVFVLNGVKDFTVTRCKALNDTVIEHADHKRLS